MKPKIVHRCLVAATLAIFPAEYNSPKAQALLLAIGMQESQFEHRQQLTAGQRFWWKSEGPAASYWQIERIGIKGVLQHHKAGQALRRVLDTLGYPDDLETLWSGIRHSDILAVAIARLILWVDPAPLPGPADTDEAWLYYLRTWRPGKPHPDRWAANYRRAWEIVQGQGA